VKYETRDGKIHTATCKTSMFSGIYWNVHAPGLTESSEPITREVQEPTTTPAEPITCLACGARIPSSHTHCPKCGLGYKDG
jgi:hypothetical protein